MDTQGLNEASAAPDFAVGDVREKLEALIKHAAAKDAIKDYNTAAELYSEATEIQAKLNGELSLENADLLFNYGKALYNVAISKSDVLGSKVAGKAPGQTAANDQAASANSVSVANSPMQGAVSSSTTQIEAIAQEAEPKDAQNKPYFKFTGDENFDTDSDADDEEGATGRDDDDPDDDDDDDLANAFEVLDLARILYHKKLGAFEQESEKGKSTETAPELRKIKEHLADTYDLQAEISLEGERFTDAVTDLRKALEFRQSLFPMEDPSIAECHYKLSLAMEFGAAKHDDLDGESNPTKVDGEMRKEAVVQMEKAIESCRVRISQEQKKLVNDDSLDEDRRAALKRRIANVKEIISDMEQRVSSYPSFEIATRSLIRPPISFLVARSTTSTSVS